MGLGRLGPIGPTLLFALVVIVNTIMWAIDDVLYTRIGHNMKPYEWWVTSFAYTISYAVMVWPVILLLMWRGSIPPESRRIALWKIAAVAGMGQVSDLFGFFPTSHLGGALQTVVGSNIPETMVMSYVLVKTRYRWIHVLGGAIIVAGVAVAVWPKLTGESQGGSNMALWIIMLMSIRFIPQTVLEEKWLKESDASVWYFLGVNSLFQVGFGLLLVFSVFIHFPGTPSLSPAELPGYLWHATECFVGVQGPTPADEPCFPTWRVWIPFMILDILTDAVAIAITKHYSAATSVVVSALILPVQTVLFQVRFFAGVATQDGLSWYAIAGLVLVTLGVLVYRASPELAVIPSVRPPSLAKRQMSADRARLLAVACEAPNASGVSGRRRLSQCSDGDGRGLSRPRQSSAVELAEASKPLLRG